MSRIKVLMVGSLPTDLTSVKGGVEAAILNLFAGFYLLEKEIEVVHVSFLEGISERKETSHASNIKIVFLPFKVKLDLIDYLVNKASLKELIAREKPDIIHIQESGPHLLRFIGWSKANIVVTQHGIMKEEFKYATGLKNKLKYLFKVLVERFVFPEFKNVIFISGYNKKLYRGHLNSSTFIGNSVNPIFFETIQRMPASRNSIIYVGVINKRKNLKLVIEALHQLNGMNIRFNLQVVGGYKERDIHYEREISDLVMKYDLKSQIHFHGWLKQHEILKVYNDCNFFILPSLQETLPVSIAEAMALGKIVIATDVGAISEMFSDRFSGFLLKKDDVNDLVSILKTINDNQEMNFDDWSDRIRDVARKKYHPLQNAKSTLDFYKNVLASGSSK